MEKEEKNCFNAETNDFDQSSRGVQTQLSFAAGGSNPAWGEIIPAMTCSMLYGPYSPTDMW